MPVYPVLRIGFQECFRHHTPDGVDPPSGAGSPTGLQSGALAQSDVKLKINVLLFKYQPNFLFLTDPQSLSLRKVAVKQSLADSDPIFTRDIAVSSKKKERRRREKRADGGTTESRWAETPV